MNVLHGRSVCLTCVDGSSCCVPPAAGTVVWGALGERLDPARANAGAALVFQAKAVPPLSPALLNRTFFFFFKKVTTQNTVTSSLLYKFHYSLKLYILTAQMG